MASGKHKPDVAYLKPFHSGRNNNNYKVQASVRPPGHVHPFQQAQPHHPQSTFQPGYSQAFYPTEYAQPAFRPAGWVPSFHPVQDVAEPAAGREGKRSHTVAMQRGRVTALVSNECYGFLSPIGSDDDGAKSVYFRFGDNSKTETGMLDLQPGDVMDYVLNSTPQRSWASYARLLQCSRRSEEVLAGYLDKLLEEKPGKVLREVTKCPAGFLLVLDTGRPSFDLVAAVLQLANRVSSHDEASLYKARSKQFYKLFPGTAFLRALGCYIPSEALRNTADNEEENREFLFRVFLLRLVEHCKDVEVISDVLSLLKGIIVREEGGGPNLSQFVLQVFATHTGLSAVNNAQELQWRKMPLYPLDAEMGVDAAIGSTEIRSRTPGLPCVVKKGAYGSTEVYLDTYFRLLKEDCFACLKKGISDLKANRLDPRDMRVWIQCSVLGAHFGTVYSGLSIAIRAENPGRKWQGHAADFPMTGSLLCISDDGGDFDSPIWGVVTHCEEENKTTVIFTEVVGDGEDTGVQSINRLLGASNIVIAESPSYYKAYQPVLRSLQNMDVEKFPFKEELVDASWPNKPPNYLASSTTLNWGCLFDLKNSLNKPSSFLTSSTRLRTNILASVKCRSMFGCTAKEVVEEMDDELKASDPSNHLALTELLNKHEVRANLSELDSLLKSGYVTTLDESQLKAVKLALNSRLVLIQGPPGTGKTYVGVKILELLLSADTLPLGPVLVITYKNHCLDQFLVSCLKFCRGKLVRVGGRSTDSSLDKYNLSLDLNDVNTYSSDWTDNKFKLTEAQLKMGKTLKQLKESNAFHIKSLPYHMLHHMPDKQLKQLLSDPCHNNMHLLKHLPPNTSLVDFIEKGIAEGTAGSKTLVSQIYQAHFQSIMQWLPSKETFELVKECLSIEKLPRALKMTYDNGNVNHDTSSEERHEDLKEENDERNELGKSTFEGPGAKKEWLKESDFFRFSPDEYNIPFGTIRRLNQVDLKEYGWVMNKNPWDLKATHRAILVYLIMQLNHEEVLRRFGDVKREYDEIIEDMKEITKRKALEVLKKATIVGMTTTGAAMHQDIIKMLGPSIIMVEEAAEVLEPQLLAAIGPSTQHLILIGDHYQLPPPVESYNLRLRHGLGVSMFERLVEHNRMPFQDLCVQSRMREEFLPMILPIYPDVRSNTKIISGERNIPPSCMISPMHFWSHSYQENVQRSFANEGEAKMVIALAKWMIAEGQKPEDITILAAYNGQVTLLREKIAAESSIQMLQVYTIDRFQGSENQIIIVSLVRSNKEGKIGHLAERNRLCVSVSRARSGVYLCGNDTTLATSKDWRILINYFKERECMGNLIHVCCPRHPRGLPLVIDCENVDLFNPFLCKIPCKAMLKCGHCCLRACHFGDHPICNESVQFVFKTCGHEVTKKCSEDETELECQHEVSFKFDKCGHMKLCRCYERSKGLKCEVLCGRLRQCGHPCTQKCFENCERHECAACMEIKKAQAEKEKEQAILEVKTKLEEIGKEIKRLELQKGRPLFIKDLSDEGDTAAEYLQVMDRTERFIQPSHGVLPIVTKIEKVSNLDLQIKFLEAQKDLIGPEEPTQMLFHGTHEKAIQGIITNGFRLPSKQKNNMFGQGCYFATDSTKSAQQIYTKGSNKLLLCEVLLGRSWMVQEPHKDMDLEQIRKKGFDSLFSKRKGNNTGGTMYDEFVIYDPKQAIVRYIVHYKTLGLGAEALNPQTTQVQQNLVRIPYESSSSFTGDSPSEYHFRLAESQFFRMSKRSEYKVVKVELILNRELHKRYEKAKHRFTEEKKQVEERLVFHGTDKNAIEKIIEEGFKIGGQDGIPVRNGKAYGSGVYTALDPSISIAYAKGSGMVLLSLALVGQEGDDYKKGGHDDVFVLNKTDHLLPRYIVHFESK